MKTSLAGRKAIAQREGNKLTAYVDSVGVLTIGVGHTSSAGAPKVTKGMKITAAESDAILSRDLATFERAVEGTVKVPVNQSQFDALVSLAFNIGGGAFAKSSLVRKLNAGDTRGAADAFLSWNKGKVNGKLVEIKGLTTRRKAERAQFLSGKPVQSDAKPVAPNEPATSATPPAASAEPVRTDSILRRGSRGPIVADLQANLNTLGYGPLHVDEHFGGDTEKAVLEFQRDHGLKVDGIAGGRTSTAIGKAIADKQLKPAIEKAEQKAEAAEQKVVEAEKTVPETAREEVKEKTSFWSWLLGALGLGGGGLSAISGAQWQTVVAIGGVAVVALVVVLIMRRQIIEAFKDINRSARS